MARPAGRLAGVDEVHGAERALVAGLVLEPARLAEVSGWLRPQDFDLPVCALVYRRLLDLHHGAGRVDPAGLVGLLRGRGELRRDGYPIVQVSGMFDGVPVPARLPVYAGVVVGGGLARQVSAAGRRLEQACAQSREPGRLLAAAAVQRAALAGAQQRWRALPAAGLLNGGPPVTPAHGSGPVRLPEPAWGAAADELATVGGVLLAPGLAAGVGRWLAPADFTDPGCRLAFDRIGQLTARGMPVDRVMLAADSAWRDGPGRAGQLNVLLARAQAAVSTAGSTGFYARRVLAASAGRQVLGAAGQLVALGERRRGGPEAVLAWGLAALDALDGVRRQTRLAAGPARTRADGAGRGPELTRLPAGRCRPVG